MKRSPGHGSITKLPDGRLWVRGPRPQRATLGYVTTPEEAELLLRAGASPRYKVDGARTFAKVAEGVLDARELEGIRGIAEERSVFRAHLSTACFAQKAIDAIDPTDVARWLRDMQGKRTPKGTPLKRSTIQRALSVASAVFVAAGPQGSGLVSTNPCADMRVRTKESRTEEPWTYLTLEEQIAIRDCQAIPLADRLAILFAIGTGLRQGEQFNLELRDLHVDGPKPHVIVRYGSKGKAPKNGKIEEVRLFGVALAAAKAWLRLLPSFCPKNPQHLVFPTPLGHRRARSKPLGNLVMLPTEGGRYVLNAARKDTKSRARFVRVPKGQGTHDLVDRFELALKAAGITRNVRWHDLRHTCASSLLSGYWGEPWTLAEVCEMLRHSSSTVTERYAHLADEAKERAVAKVGVGSDWVSGNGGSGSSVAAISSDFQGVEQRGIEPLTSALRTRNLLELLRGLTEENGQSNPVATQLASALLTVLERGQA